MTAFYASANTVATTGFTWGVEKNNKKSVGKISPIIMSIVDCYRGFSKAKIARIYENCF